MTASGLISAPLAAMADLLAACAAFRTWTGTADPLGAAARIDVVLQTVDRDLVDAESDYAASRAARAAVRPRAVVQWGPQTAGETFADAGRYAGHELTIEVTLERACAADESEADAMLALLNAAGSIWDDLWETQGTAIEDGGCHLTLHEAHLTAPPARMDERDVAAGEVDLYAMSLEFTAREG